MDSKSGTYILVFRNAAEFSAQVGKLGSTTISAGYCAYVGSAFGPGGLKSRIARHCKEKKIHKWHIDYIRDYLDLIEVWYTTNPQKVECLWSNKLHSLGGTCPANKLGSSDCKCESHFFHFKTAPGFESFKNMSPEDQLISVEIGL